MNRCEARIPNPDFRAKYGSKGRSIRCPNEASFIDREIGSVFCKEHADRYAFDPRPLPNDHEER